MKVNTEAAAAAVATVAQLAATVTDRDADISAADTTISTCVDRLNRIVTQVDALLDWQSVKVDEMASLHAAAAAAGCGPAEEARRAAARCCLALAHDARGNARRACG